MHHILPMQKFYTPYFLFFIFMITVDFVAVIVNNMVFFFYNFKIEHVFYLTLIYVVTKNNHSTVIKSLLSGVVHFSFLIYILMKNALLSINL